MSNSEFDCIYMLCNTFISVSDDVFFACVRKKIHIDYIYNPSPKRFIHVNNEPKRGRWRVYML